ncbi:hypothetical protein CIL05_07305 [Virgibacillus profundi]|uniref:YopX protein domain-containing protein n=1 Tax=Virgibacillus profundi TaxID=2024555 RepID=A0A2A2IFX1_9BACI|nr:YopX family protein [Virgibacillus profundi]PAV30268.1 hypothetical protein CIL05_07305 [Virgibacillus profundi]PXY54440.1 hypothetical protein CIT14_07390 [Virgibacillus profundi]
MREIKFRAWIEKDKKMVDLSSLEFDRCGFPEAEGDQILFEVGYRKRKSDWVYKTARNIVVMQYTGLKDRYNTEIYEGDYVIGINRITEAEIEHEVTFLNGCFMFGNWNAHEYFNKHAEIFISGNKFENK